MIFFGVKNFITFSNKVVFQIVHIIIQNVDVSEVKSDPLDDDTEGEVSVNQELKLSTTHLIKLSWFRMIKILRCRRPNDVMKIFGCRRFYDEKGNMKS